MEGGPLEALNSVTLLPSTEGAVVAAEEVTTNCGICGSGLTGNAFDVGALDFREAGVAESIAARTCPACGTAFCYPKHEKELKIRTFSLTERGLWAKSECTNCGEPFFGGQYIARLNELIELKDIARLSNELIELKGLVGKAAIDMSEWSEGSELVSWPGPADGFAGARIVVLGKRHGAEYVQTLVENDGGQYRDTSQALAVLAFLRVTEAFETNVAEQFLMDAADCGEVGLSYGDTGDANQQRFLNSVAALAEFEVLTQKGTTVPFLARYATDPVTNNWRRVSVICALSHLGHDERAVEALVELLSARQRPSDFGGGLSSLFTVRPPLVQAWAALALHEADHPKGLAALRSVTEFIHWDRRYEQRVWLHPMIPQLPWKLSSEEVQAG